MKAATCLLALGLATVTVTSQGPAPARGDAPRRIDERLRALQKEGEALAQQAQTLVGELRQLEIERDLRALEAREAEAAVAEAQRAIAATTERLGALEAQRQAQLPDLEQQLVDIYKRGRTTYARLLAGAGGLREFARATRAVAALAAINERRVAEHRRTLDTLAEEKAALERHAADLRTRDAAARRARAAADRAVAAHNALIAQIDSRRDLAARYVGELQVAYNRLQQQLAAGRTGEAVAVPLAPFRNALEWPVNGRVTGRFGQAAGRLGGTAVRNGVEIAAPEGTPVRAIHDGTVGHAEPFTGFGNLVIVEHDAENYSLYGYLGSVAVSRGDAVGAGDELGRVGLAPAGPPALYFELRIDGRSVDPLQWLRAR
jgi:septal ring factor EnvC (AmiA/AmiB activator)